MDLSILYMGMRGTFSLVPLQALLDAGLNVAGIVVPWQEGSAVETAACVRLHAPKQAGDLPMARSFLDRSIIQLGWERNIPVYESRQFGAPQSLSLLSQIRPDVAAVACYPEILSPSALALAPLGFINIHPSRLPDFRGPDPLFWSFRAGVTETAVTLHWMDRLPDSGPIVKQAPLTMPDGISGKEAEKMCAKLGGELLVEAMWELSMGELRSRPQPAGGSSQPLPSRQDFRLSLEWSARRAFNFMRATAERGAAFPINVGTEELNLVEAVDCQEPARAERALVRDGRDVWIRFASGVLHARTGR